MTMLRCALYLAFVFPAAIPSFGQTYTITELGLVTVPGDPIACLAAKALGPGTYRADIIIQGRVVGSGVFGLR